jgi:hypothetical protein
MIRKQAALCLTLAALICAASACSRPPGPAVSLHPPASDLRTYAADDPNAPAGACRAESPAPDPDDPTLTNAQVDSWELAALQEGRGCRDTVARICRWHQHQNPQLDCGVIAPAIPPPP